MRYPIAAIVALSAALFIPCAAQAQTAPAAPAAVDSPSASPMPSATPFQGFNATGAMTLQAQMSGTPFTLTTNVSMMSNRKQVRVDLLSFSMTGSDPNATALAKAMMPTGGLTFVVDQRTNTLTVWSSQKHLYYQQKLQKKPAPTATPAASSSQIDLFLNKTSSMATMESFNQSLNLVGHQPVNGHQAALFHFTMQSKKQGEEMQQVDADIAFADDLGGIPLRLWGDIKGKYNASLKFDLTSVTTNVPPASVFAIPTGYQKAKSIIQLMGSSAPASLKG